MIPRLKKWTCNLKPASKTGSDIPAGLENIIEAAKEETQNNTNDTKDIGGMKTDKGISKSPIQ